MQGGHMTKAKNPDGSKLLKPLMLADVAIIFAAANAASKSNVLDDNAASDDEPDDGGSMMVLYEWAYAISRLALECFPSLPGDKAPSLAKRAEVLVRRIILPTCADRLAPVSPLQDHLFTRKVRAVFLAYDEPMRDVFGCYSKADRRSTAAERHLGEMNIAEYLFLLADGGMLTSGLSTKTAAAIFEQICQLYQGDSNEQEMLYPEFLTMVARLFDLTQTEEDRRAEGWIFEHALAKWLEEFFVPKFTKLVAKKQRGNAKATL